jgi:hypothetical protein
MRRLMFRTVSQTAIRYRGSRLSAGRLGSLRGGDRLPWVGLDGSSTPKDNFAVLDGRQWQVHVYGAPGIGLAEECQAMGLPLHVFAWQPAMRKAGLTRNALYLIRPDGYLALVDRGRSAAALARHMEALSGRGRDTGAPRMVGA